MALIEDGIHRPGFEVESGRLWTPGSVIPDDVKTDTTDQLAAMVSSPYTKYVFVTPKSGYNVQDYIDWRDDNAFVGSATINAVGACVFWLGDSSSCGGTVIQHNPDDPMQEFLRDAATQEAFSLAKIGRGGFFLLGDRQGAGVTATEIKKIVIDCDLDFIVLGLHRTGTGTQPEFSVAAFRHLVASLRWDMGPAKPIILMVSDENSNVHLMAESNRGNLFVGDISDQDTEEKQVALLDRAGYLSLNWWPLMAFVPNADDGLAVETTVLGMQNKLFHPMLVPVSGSGCPFNTTRALTASEMEAARTVFVTPEYPGPVSNPKVRTTSAWFWDFETVKNTSTVKAWSVLRGNLDASFDNIDYMSDMQVVFDSMPRWVGHPIYNMPFAVEFRMEARSVQNQVLWDANVNVPGNIPALHGVKDQEEEDEVVAGLLSASTLPSNSGWLTIVTPFELSPTANLFYKRDVTQDVRGVPVIPPWVEFAWLHEVSQESSDGGGGFLGIPRFINDLLELIEDALVWLPNQVYDLSTNDASFQKWSAGLNQPHVVLRGTPGVSTKVGVDEDGIGVTETEGVETLKLENAPFAVYVQTVNFKMGPVTDEETGAQLGFVWPGRMFYVIPIVISDVILQMFDPVSTPAGLTAWNDLGFDLEGHGGTPVTFEADESITDEFLALHLPRRDILLPLVDHKADFPPMLDSEDGLLNRDFSNHLARIDITHPSVLRARESAFGGRTGRGRGFATKGVLTSWPVPDDREITITQDFFGTYKTYSCGPHRALDLQYTDGSHSTSTPILAAGPGTVRFLSCEECGGHSIEIIHQIPPLPSEDTFITRYLHLDRRAVLDGANVEAGETIGFMGDRGSPGALHLHFAINMDGTCGTAQNPCDELPAPANGTNVECVGSTTEQLICELFSAAIEAAGDSPLITDDHGNVVRKVDAALAIARFESAGGSCGLNELAQNCITIPGLGLFSHVGLFQIQNPTHIANDVGAGNISQASVVTGDPNCPGIEIAQDYKTAYNNILAAIRISSAGSNFGPWATWTETNPATGELYYRECLGGGCPQ